MNKQISKLIRSRARGASMIALATIIGFLILPPIGMFVFEVNRYQFVQRQLEKIVDAASLAGGRRLAEANVMAASDESQAQYWRHLQAIEAAWDFITGYGLQNGGAVNQPTQYLYSVGLTRNGGDGHLVQVPVPGQGQMTPSINQFVPNQPNQGAVKIYPCNPDNNFAEVPLGDPLGRAIAVEMVFNEVPAFGKYLGFSFVPVRTISSAGAARVDIVLCMDMSGSMDDCTRVTAVSEVVAMRMPQGDQALYTNPGPPPTPPPLTAYAGCSYDPTVPMCGTTQDTCINGVYSPYMTAMTAWQTQFTATRNKNLVYQYNIVFQGRLRELVSATQRVDVNGTSVNCVADKHWNYLTDVVGSGDPMYWQNGAYRHFPTASDCQDTYWTTTAPFTPTNKYGKTDTGIDEILVNLGPMCNTPSTTGPNFGPLNQCPQPFTYSYNGSSYYFGNLSTVAEAAQGTLNQPAGWQQKMNALDPTGTLLANTQQAGAAPVMGGGGKDWLGAYTDASKRVMQPYQTVCEAAEDFIKALEGSGKDIRVAVLSFERTVPPAPSSGPPYVINNVPINDTNNQPPDPTQPPDNFAPTNLITNLIPTSDPTIDQLKKRIYSVTPMRETDIGDALQTAYGILQAQVQHDGGNNRPAQGIVLVTDGQPSDQNGNPLPDPRPIVSGWNPMVPVYCVGLNQLGEQDPGGIAFLQGMQTYLGDGINADPANGVAPGNGVAAISQGTYVQAPSASKLHDALVSVARKLVALVE